MQGIGVDLMTKEEYLKKHNVTEKMFLTYCVNALNDNFIDVWWSTTRAPQPWPL